MRKLIFSVFFTILSIVLLISTLSIITFGATITIGNTNCSYSSLKSPFLKNEIKNGDTLQIVGTFSSSTLPENGTKHITITGDTLDLTNMGTVIDVNGYVTFENININVAENATIYANGNKVIIGENVTFSNTVFAIYGGGAAGTDVDSTDLTVLSGDFINVYGGSNGGTVTGDTKVTVGGSTNASDIQKGSVADPNGSADYSDYFVYGGGSGDTIKGNTHLTFTGNARTGHLYGGSMGNASIIGGDKYVTVSGGSAISIYGGNNCVNAGKNTYLTVEGGTFQQLFGGNNEAEMKGDVDLRVMGGTVTRRIYGGCYNEISGEGEAAAFSSFHCVNGSITLTIGGNAVLDLSHADGDTSIYARSRCGNSGDAEVTSLVFADDAAYQKHSNKLQTNDSKIAFLMGNVSAAERIHRHTYTADGAIITQKCDQGCADATATLTLTDGGPFIYNGKAHTPAYSIAYSDNWTAYALTVTYNDHINAGKATVMAATVDGIFASLSFTIDKAVCDAPVLTACAETVKGKADGTITGLSTDMEWSTDGTKYTPVTDTAMTFAAGAYHIRYAESRNCTRSDSTTVTICAGTPLSVTCKIDGVSIRTFEIDWNGSLSESDLPAIPTKEGCTQVAPYWNVTNAQLSNIQADLVIEAVYTKNRYTVTLPAVQIGYTLTAEPNIVPHGSSCTLTFTLSAGFCKTDDFSVKINQIAIVLNESNQYTFTATDNLTVTVEGIKDLIPPTAVIQIGSDTFDGEQAEEADHYYGIGTTVTVTAEDAGSGVQTVEYLFSDTTLTAEQLKNAVWTPYSEPFVLPADGLKLLYVKVTDNAGDTAYTVTPRIGIDQTKPVIPEIKNGGTVYGDLLFTVIDENSVTVTVDGNKVQKFGNAYTVTADNAVHTIIVTDAVGNASTYTVTVYRICTVTFMQDSVIYTIRTIGYGLDLTDIPTPPAKEGHTAAWSSTVITNVTKNLTINVIYTPITYTVTLPQNTVGYTINGTGSTLYGSEYKITLSLAEGYSKTDHFALKLNNTAITLNGSSYSMIVKSDVIVTVEGVADITPPLVSVKVGTTYVSQSLKVEANDKYFNADATVTLDASDNGTGVQKRLYLFSADFLSESDLATVTGWLPYEGALALAANEAKFLYVKVIDNAGNVTLVSTAKLHIDAAAPVICGFTSGGIVYGNLFFTVTDNLTVNVKIDGRPIEAISNSYTVTADNNTHTVTATDAVGNECIYTVTVYRIYTITFKKGNEVCATKSVGHGQELTDIPTPPAITGHTTAWEIDSFTCILEDMEVALIQTPCKYTVTLPSSPVGYTVAAIGGTTVSYGGTFTFTVTVSAGYDKAADFSVRANGRPLTPVGDHTYCITVTDHITVTVTGISDRTAPAINGFTNGATVYGDLRFTVTDTLTVTVTLDNNAIERIGDFYTVAADNGTHTIQATDSAGNTVAYTVTVYRIYTVTFIASNVKIAEKQVNHGQALTDIPAIPVKEGYTATTPTWSVASFDAITADMTVTAVYTADLVKEAPSSSDGGTDNGSASSDGNTDQMKASNHIGKNDVNDSDRRSAIIIILAVTGSSVAVGGSVLGILLYKKKKR